MTEALNIAEFTLAVEDFLRPFPRETKVARERTEQLDDLGNVIIVFAVFCTGLRVKEVVTCDEFKDLVKQTSEIS